MNICGISEHSKTELEKYLVEKRLFFVSLNETKTFWIPTSSKPSTRKLPRLETLAESRFQLTKRYILQESTNSNARIKTASGVCAFLENSNS